MSISWMRTLRFKGQVAPVLLLVRDTERIQTRVFPKSKPGSSPSIPSPSELSVPVPDPAACEVPLIQSARSTYCPSWSVLLGTPPSLQAQALCAKVSCPTRSAAQPPEERAGLSRAPEQKLPPGLSLLPHTLQVRVQGFYLSPALIIVFLERGGFGESCDIASGAGSGQWRSNPGLCA